MRGAVRPRRNREKAVRMNIESATRYWNKNGSEEEIRIVCYHGKCKHCKGG
jgi:hypothetical protein